MIYEFMAKISGRNIWKLNIHDVFKEQMERKFKSISGPDIQPIDLKSSCLECKVLHLREIDLKFWLDNCIICIRG